MDWPYYLNPKMLFSGTRPHPKPKVTTNIEKRLEENIIGTQDILTQLKHWKKNNDSQKQKETAQVALTHLFWDKGIARCLGYKGSGRFIQKMTPREILETIEDYYPVRNLSLASRKAFAEVCHIDCSGHYIPM